LLVNNDPRTAASHLQISEDLARKLQRVIIEETSPTLSRGNTDANTEMNNFDIDTEQHQFNLLRDNQVEFIENYSALSNLGNQQIQQKNEAMKLRQNLGNNQDFS